MTNRPDGLPPRPGETGKLYPVQGQIGGPARRLRACVHGAASPRPRVGRSRSSGNRDPRWMTVAVAQAAAQDSAYRPSRWRSSIRGVAARRDCGHGVPLDRRTTADLSHRAGDPANESDGSRSDRTDRVPRWRFDSQDGSDRDRVRSADTSHPLRGLFTRCTHQALKGSGSAVRVRTAATCRGRSVLVGAEDARVGAALADAPGAVQVAHRDGLVEALVQALGGVGGGGAPAAAGPSRSVDGRCSVEGASRCHAIGAIGSARPREPWRPWPDHRSRVGERFRDGDGLGPSESHWISGSGDTDMPRRTATLPVRTTRAQWPFGTGGPRPLRARATDPSRQTRAAISPLTGPDSPLLWREVAQSGVKWGSVVKMWANGQPSGAPWTSIGIAHDPGRHGAGQREG